MNRRSPRRQKKSGFISWEREPKDLRFTAFVFGNMNFISHRTYLSGKNLGALCYLAFVIFLCFSAAKQTVSDYYAQSAILARSQVLADAAISFAPENPNAYYASAMISLDNRDYQEAAASFEKAIYVRKNDYLLWLRLGNCRVRLNDFNSAQMAYEKALDLAPNYSQPNYYLGIGLLENGQPEQAFRYLSKAAQGDKTLYPEILHLASTTFPNNPQAIEASMRPNSYDERKLVARYLIDQGFVTDGVKSLLTGSELAANDKDEFVQYLIAKRNFQLAREVWASGQKADDISNNDLIFDGGFEKIAAGDNGAFGWHIDQTATAISVALDDRRFHSGSRALRIKFAGNVELSRRLISQLTYLKPRRRYQLKFFFNSPELISAGLPAIEVNDGVSDNLLGRSNDLQSTQGRWVEVKIDFVTQDTPAVTIGLQRPSCNTSPCPIFGELILDTFSLAEI